MLVCANYVGGSAKLFQIGSDGSLTPGNLVKFKEPPGGYGPEERQTQSYPHHIIFAGDDHVLSPDIGGDCIR